MESPIQAVVYHLLASRLHIDSTSIEDAQCLDKLDLDPLDLVLVAMKLEDFDRRQGDFPIAALERAFSAANEVERCVQLLV